MPAVSGALWAFLSDVHSNWVALQAVWKDMLAFAPERVYNLGDTVGYGPEPAACVQWMQEHARVSLLGNHDAGVVGLLPLEWFNPVARAALEWTARRLSPAQRMWLSARSPSCSVEEPGKLRLFLAHGTPREPLTEYVDAEVAADVLRKAPFDVCLVGHTHLMGVYTRRGYRPLHGTAEIQLEPPCLVNVGSVGQPRDGRPEAGYVLLDPASGRLIARRVAYDVQATQLAMRQAGLPEVLAERLSFGQ